MEDNKKLQYEQHKRAAAARQADLAEAGQEIGSIPAVVDPSRRADCRLDFRLYCETYHREWFKLAWSADHLKAIHRIEGAVLEGKLFAFAMPRGSGKTALCLAAVLWALAYGHHRFVVLIGSTQRTARKLLDKIYQTFERNERLMEDFPEICFPVRCLERTPQRARKQKVDGKYTSMVWTRDEIVLPTIDASPSSGAIVTVCGLTGGEVLGQVRAMPDGTLLRPSLFLGDDPQTRRSAHSRTQTQERVELLQSSVLGMAGPDKNIAGLLTCTIISPGDAADQLTDPEQNPEWQGERTKLVYAFPTDEGLWEQYAVLRAEGMRRGDKGAAGNEFYAARRAAMDAGASVAWAERMTPDCLSAIQYAMNLKLRNEQAFFSEYQNEPLEAQVDDEFLAVEEIMAKVNRRAEGTIPTSCNDITMFIDVGKKLLWYAIVAFERNFTSYVVDYGAYPDPHRQYFSNRDARRTLAMVCKGQKEERTIQAGLEALCGDKLGRTWTRDDGARMKITLCMIDTGYQKDTVELFCRQTPFSGVVMPYKGWGVGAASIPIAERSQKKGEQPGDNWKITGSQGSHSLRLVLCDTNHWKTFVHSCLATGIGAAGCLSLPGKSETRHRMIAEHLTNESPVRTEGRGRKLIEWKDFAHHPDNHLFDCLTGCMCGASMLGCGVLATVIPRPPRKAPKKSKAKYY